MDSISRLLRAIVAGGVAGWLVLSATSAFAQGMYLKEIEKDGRIYVFNIQANAERFEKTGEMGVGITMLGVGPKGETVIGDNEKALQLYFYKHNLQVVVPDPPPAPPPAPPWRISGLVFGDYYYFGDSQPQAAFQDQHGMWLRRAYFTYDHRFSPAITTRLRLEANGNGRLAGGSATPFVKDAYMAWTFHGRQELITGIQPSLTFDYIEGFWGLRHIEKTPLDLYATDSSRDTGFTVRGPINTSGSMRYAYQFGNESGNNGEVDKFKIQRATFRFEKNPGFAVEGFWAHSDRNLQADRETAQIFLGWRNPKGRVGFHYTFQKREAATNAPANTPDIDLNIYSGFGVLELPRRKVSFFLRLDRYDDPCLDCGAIAYFPAATNAPFTTTIGGMEYYILPSVRISPNFEYVSFGDPATGTKPKNMSVARFTFYWVW
jgi:hypothetical protein